jgi:hypothetical protein
MSDREEYSQNLLHDEEVKEVLERVSKKAKVKQETSTLKTEDDEEELGMLEKFPFYGLNTMVRDKFRPHGVDPRGYTHPYGSKLPSDYCKHCKCKQNLCHDKRFGLYCGLRVGELIEKKGAGTLFGDNMKELMKQAYNEILRVEIVQQIGVLDTHNNYDPPKCMEDRSFKNILNHFFYMKFTAAMKRRLQDGSKGEYGSGSFGFYTALKEQDSKKNA